MSELTKAFHASLDELTLPMIRPEPFHVGTEYAALDRMLSQFPGLSPDMPVSDNYFKQWLANHSPTLNEVLFEQGKVNQYPLRDIESNLFYNRIAKEHGLNTIRYVNEIEDAGSLSNILMNPTKQVKAINQIPAHVSKLVNSAGKFSKRNLQYFMKMVDRYPFLGKYLGVAGAYYDMLDTAAGAYHQGQEELRQELFNKYGS